MIGKRGARPWTGRKQAPKLRGLVAANGKVTSARVQDLVAIAAGAWQCHQRSRGLDSSLAGRPRALVEVTQCAGREPWSFGEMPTIGTKSLFYSFGHDQVLTPRLLSFVHGYPDSLTANSVTVSEYRRLQGNALYGNPTSRSEHGCW